MASWNTTKLLTLATIVIIASAGIGIYLIGNDDTGNSPPNDNPLDSSLLAGYRAEIGDSVALGIMNGESILSPTSYSPQPSQMMVLGNASGDDPQEGKKNRLVGFDNEDVMTEVIFTKIVETMIGPDVITQNDFKAQVDKLYITEDYIYFTLTLDVINRTDDPEYDQKGYICNDLTQSFLIDKKTGNVYSLADIPHIEYLEGDIVCTIVNNKKTFYALEFENDQIIFTDLVPNKNIIVDSCVRDKNGWLLINNDTIDQIGTKTIYYMNSGKVQFAYGNDDNFYRVEFNGTGPYIEAIQVFDFNSEKWTCPDVLEPVIIHILPSYTNSESYVLIKSDGIHLAINGTYVARHVFDLQEGRLYNSNIADQSDHIDWGSGKDKAYIFGENILCLRDDSVYVYKTTDNTKAKYVITLKNITLCEVNGDTVTAVVEEINGTNFYTIYVDENGDMQFELSKTNNYGEGVIIIKPL